MQVAQIVGIAATGLWLLALTVHIAAACAAFIQPGLRRRAVSRADRPAVSVIIPVKNLEPALDRAFASIFSQNYPAFEVIVTAAEQESEAIALARAVASRFPQIKCRFMLGNPRVTHNPKVSNLGPAIAAADHALILIKDANIELAAGQIADLVGNLTPGVGMVCAIPIAAEPRSFCATVEAAEMNGRAAPLLMGASVLGVDVGFGKVMLFDRGDFNRVDGLSVMAPTFGDDHALAKAFAGVGLRTVFAPSVIRQTMGVRTCRAVWERQLRWMVIRRDEAPFVFFGEIFFGLLFATLAGTIGFSCLGWPALAAALGTPLVWIASEALVVAAKGWGLSLLYPIAAVCREFIFAAMWLRAWFSRHVQWAGQPFDVGGRPSA